MMMYVKNNSKELDKKLFRNPSSEYRAAPFWAWNCELDKDELLWQIERLKEMGFGGFYMHSRDGMATTYLSDEFMELIKACCYKAESMDMLAYLYDEDRWPSGFAGGYVTKERKYSQKELIFTVNKFDKTVSYDEFVKTGKPYFVAAFEVKINDNGELAEYQRIDGNKIAKGTKWYVYSYASSPSGRFNNQSYVDTLSKSAIDKFIDITYERYKEIIGGQFGTTVNTIFTDEPMFKTKDTFDFADDKSDIIIPWTADFGESFEKEYGFDLTERLPELLWELPEGEVSLARYYYHVHISKLFAENYADNCGKWCEKNGIALTGHVMGEATLNSQTNAIGEAMRTYLHFGMPGIDMLCNGHEYTTAKQAQSVVHQLGKVGMTSEVDGVTNWNFDFRGHKLHGDWQAALGVTHRVPHLAWVSMKGSSKRDYPGSINYQSSWYTEYKIIEDHYARLNTVLTRGKPIVKVGVIHPIESYWLHYGPKENTESVRDMLDKQFQNIAEWLLSGQIDFDYISEGLLSEEKTKIGKSLTVGDMEYEVILVAGCETLRSTTFEMLKQFRASGGKIVFAGDAPQYIDAVKSELPMKLYKECNNVRISKPSILNALETERIVDIREENGVRSDKLVYQMREDNNCKWLFIAYMRNEDESERCIQSHNRKIIVKGEYTPLIYDTLTGDIKKAEYEIKDGKTTVYYTFYMHDSLLLRLCKPEKNSLFFNKYKKKIIKTDFIFDKVKYKRSEPNVVVLDIGEYCIDDGIFEGPDEMRKVQHVCKNRLSLVNDQSQPWVRKEESAKHTVTIRYKFYSEYEAVNTLFATEEYNGKIRLNDIQIENKVLGYFTDKSIKTIPLPKLKKGENVIEITYPIGNRTTIENVFILGDFNVKCEGITKTITPKTDMIGFGDVVHQGMPFYGANITYEADIDVPENCDVRISIGTYIGACIKVKLDDSDLGIVAFSPYEVSVENVTKGKHILTMILYGNRNNSFGALHLNHEKNIWWGPEAWDFMFHYDFWCKYEWMYEYNLKKLGIIASPKIIYEKRDDMQI